MTPTARTTQEVTHTQAWPLYGATSSRQVEQQAQASLPPHTLMQRAGWAVAELALAVAPHSQRIWIACGPGNNGGDGLEAAVHLHRWGKSVHVTWLGSLDTCPDDTRAAHQRFLDAGLTLQTHAPTTWDLAIDALLGLGCTRAPESTLAQWLVAMHHSDAPVLHVDLHSGLCADTGVWHGRATIAAAPQVARRAHPSRHTLALLTLKPGLFTADGRDASGRVWFNALGVTPTLNPDAWLQSAQAPAIHRDHNSHKGSYGDVLVVGGASGMTGAALLAGHAALRSGAGRVMVALLDDVANAAASAHHPTLMLRDAARQDMRHLTVVCGCGGGDAVRGVLPRVLSTARQLVLDADGLNALQDSSLWTLLLQRATRGWATVLTPHPLEAARLLRCTVTEVQQDRLRAAQSLAQATGAVVVLKGSGTVIADPGSRAEGQVTANPPVLNPTGNAKLASAGSGDVLAGCVGALMAQGYGALDAACAAVAHHGLVADQWPQTLAFDALVMTQRL